MSLAALVQTNNSLQNAIELLTDGQIPSQSGGGPSQSAPATAHSEPTQRAVDAAEQERRAEEAQLKVCGLAAYATYASCLRARYELTSTDVGHVLVLMPDTDVGRVLVLQAVLELSKREYQQQQQQGSASDAG
eukprot:935925-Rhodomonas_salina.1